jgi:hypothetical protein
MGLYLAVSSFTGAEGIATLMIAPAAAQTVESDELVNLKNYYD